jgi:hypothetical protein
LRAQCATAAMICAMGVAPSQRQRHRPPPRHRPSHPQRVKAVMSMLLANLECASVTSASLVMERTVRVRNSIPVLFLSFSDINGCLSHTCHTQAACIDLAPPRTGFSCLCNTGYTGSGFSCISLLIPLFSCCSYIG